MKKWMTPIITSLTGSLVSLIVYTRLPESMAVHFGPSGSPDNWVNKPIGAFLLPALILLVTALVMFTIRFEKDENKRRRIQASIGSITAIISGLLLAVHLLIITYNLGYELSIAKFATIIIGILFIMLGNLVPRLTQGSMQWPKLPQAMERKAARFLGKFMFILGFGFLLISLLPSPYIFPAFFVLLSIFVITVAGSMLSYTRSH
jgi:uncharacterized membrane protein